MKGFEKGIDLFEKEQYDKAFAQFIKCKEYYLAGICKLNLGQINQSINMFVLAIKKYKDNCGYEVKTERGTAPIIMIYITLIKSLLKINELDISLSAMVYGLKESEYLKKRNIDQLLYNSVKITFEFHLQQNGILEKDYDSIYNDFSLFFNRKLKYMAKKNIVIVEDDVMPMCMNIVDLSHTSINKNTVEDVGIKSTSEDDFGSINNENKLIKTIIIMEFKKSKYLRVVKYMYTIDNNLRYFFNKETNNLDYEQILEDINIESKSDNDISSLKETLNKKYNITKEVSIIDKEYETIY